MSYILAFDQGTTSSRAFLFDDSGNILCSHREPLQALYPQANWVEHRPEDIWQTQYKCAVAVMDALQVRLGLNTLAEAVARIDALGITNQRETTLVWDRQTGEPLYNAISWQDRRTNDVCESLASQGHALPVQKRTGLVLDAYFSASKLAWILDNVDGARLRAERGELCFGTVDSWLLYKLTEGRVHATDVSNAARTLLLNLHTLQWDDTLLRLFRIPRAMLPSLVASSGLVAETTLFGPPLLIAGLAGDQQSAAFGQNCFAPGMAKNTYGTGCFMLMNTGSQPLVSSHQLLSTVGWQSVAEPTRSAYCLEGTVFMGGATLQWLRDCLEIVDSAVQVEALAASVPDTGDVYFVPAHTGLGSPYWDAHARAMICGMTPRTTKAHIARAALEGIAWQCAHVFEVMRLDSGIALAELRVDGGVTANNLLLQMQADILGVPVLRPQVTQTAALGVAYLAGLATGVWHSVREIASQWRLDRCFEPTWSLDERLDKRARWARAVKSARNWAA